MGKHKHKKNGTALQPRVVGIKHVPKDNKPRISTKTRNIIIGVSAIVLLLVAGALAAYFVRDMKKTSDANAAIAEKNATCPDGTVPNDHMGAATTLGKCVQCNEDDDCFTGHMCQHGSCTQACTSDAECPSSAGHCVNGGCAACSTSADCAGQAVNKLCLSGACIECLNDNQCSAGETCDATSHVCVPGCGTSGTCASGTVCSPASNTCIQCASDADCAGATPTCDTSSHLCVACTVSADCPAGETCNTYTNACHASYCTALSTNHAGKSATMTLRTGTGNGTCLTRAGKGACPTDDGSPYASTGSCLQFLPCGDGNKSQWWVQLKHGDGDYLATTAEDSAAVLDAKYVTAYLQPPSASLHQGGSTPEYAHTYETRSTDTSVSLGMTPATHGFFITYASPGASPVYLAPSSSASNYASWVTTTSGDASGAVFVAKFVNSSFTSCATS